MLDLDFSDEQEMLREMVRGLCAQHCPHEEVRRLEDDPVGYSPDTWRAMAELGLVGLMLPEDHGGAGSSLLDGVVLYEELGASPPTPHLESSVMAAGAILRAGSADQQAAWLPRIAAGEAVVVPAWLEPGNSFGPRGVELRAVPDGDGVVLTGAKVLVRFAEAADALLVLARTGDDERDVDLFLVDRQAPGVSVDQRHTIASDAQFRVDLDGVRVSEADRVGAAGTGWDTWEDVMVDAMVLAAALANGGAQHALDITVEYAKQRHQFDKPLGAFQALAHDMANARTAIDGSKLLTYEAAWARGRAAGLAGAHEGVGSGDAPDDAKLAAMAKLFACTTYRDTTAMAQQIFGGVGFTLDYEIQLYFRRAKALQLSFNDTRRCEDLVAAAVLD